MATIAIPYGTETQQVTVPDAQLRAVLRPLKADPLPAGQRAAVEAALENPIASPRLRELAKSKTKILVITSDHTRPVPSRITMPLLLHEIRQGNPQAEITLLIATGMHRPTTTEELRAKLGDDIVEQETIVIHDATKTEDMVFFGTLPSGGALWLNRLVEEAQLVVAEGFIEPHFFAGFSGGRKSILPGVAAKETVLFNHNAQFIQNPLARQGSLERNPIHEDMMFAAKQAKLGFILNVLMDEDKRILAAVAGEHEKAHLAGCALCRELTQVEAVPCDIAITSNGGYPLDQNVYQAVKGMTAAAACVRKGGVIILCAALGDGHGGEAFYRWFAQRDSPEKVREDIENISPEDTRMDQWEAQILARVLCHATCFFVTDPTNRPLIERMHMRWAPDVNTALASAFELVGAKAAVTVIPDGVGIIIENPAP